jgi:hypothetical protein
LTATTAGPWIVGPRYDTLFFTASLLVPLTLWAGFSVGLLTGVAVYVLFQLLFNMPHNFQTWTMSVMDPADRAKHGRRYLVAAVVCLAVLGLPMAFSPDGVYPWVRDALIYWGYYHLVRQHDGFLRIYERKMGGVTPTESLFYKRFVDVVCYLPLLIRFRDPSQMTIYVGDSATWIGHPMLPRAVWLPLAVIYTAFVAAALVHHVKLRLDGRRHLMPRFLLLTSITVAFALAGLVIPDFIVAVAVVTAFHNLQYLGLTWYHNRNRAAERAPDDRNRAIGWLGNGQAWVYIVATVLFGVVVFSPRAIFQSHRVAELPLAFVVAMHYYVDSRLWRFNLYPERGRWLRLSGPRAA